MDFELSEDQDTIRRAVAELAGSFDEEYWLEKDTKHEFPWEFYKAFADAGWLGVCVPEDYGGSGLGILEASLILEEVSASGAGMNGASCMHMSIFGMHPVIVHGSEELKAATLPRVVSGDLHVCFGVTEPDAGLDTTRIKTFARRNGDGYLINGRKVWISKALESEKVLLLTRTTKLEDCAKKTDGMTLFLTDLDRDRVDIRPIPKMGREAVDSNELFIDNLEVPEEHRVGEEGKGFKYLLDGLNPERVLIAVEALGLGRAAIRRAVAYGKERVVFGRPIGMNQGLQFPLADAQMKLDAATLMVRKAAWLYDRGLPCGREANAAKYLCAEAGFEAADRAVQMHGGMGYAREYHVERYFREARLLRIAPISQEMVLNYIGEHVLGLPPVLLMGRLDERVALVTGAGAGIGAAVARRLAAEGASVAVLDVDRAAAAMVAEEIVEAGGTALAAAANVADSAQVEDAVAQAAELGDHIHIAVSNAGIVRPAMLADLDETRFRQVLDVHLMGTYHVVRAVLAYLPDDGRGRIINSTSAAGLVGTIGQANYAAAKAAIVGFTKSAARELARRQITVNAVAPLAATAMTETVRTNPKFAEQTLARIPLGRWAEPEEIAGAFAFLASDDASYITGQVLCVDGGTVI